MWLIVLGCADPLPPAAGPVAVRGLAIRVAPAVAAVGDPRYHDAPGRYAANEEPWRWTEDERIAAAAYDLADLVYRGAGVRPEVRPWDGSGGGFRVGRPEDFGLPSPFGPATPTRREQHLVRTVADGVLVLGVEAAGVELAEGALARALGYRWTLPGPAWEIVPRFVSVPAIDRVSDGPRLAARRITGPVSGADGLRYARWSRANGFVGGLQVKGVQGQWGPIARALGPWLDANPGAVSASSRPEVHDGRTNQIKWCPAYRDADGRRVSDVVAEVWAQPRLGWDAGASDNTATRDVLALHQGDSAFWAGCDDGSTPADRAVAFASEVSERIGGQRWVSVLGYREVFPGPRRERVPPTLFVWVVGRGYLGVRWDDAVDRWRAAGARHLGGYLYWNHGSRRIPADDVGLFAVRERESELHALVDRGFEALWVEQDGLQAVGGWWKWALLSVARDPSLAVDAAIADLARTAFPEAARAPVQRYLGRFDGSDARFLWSPEWIDAARADLREAWQASAGDPAAVRRIEDLAIGLRWVELQLWPDAEALAELQGCAAGRDALDRPTGPVGACPTVPLDRWLAPVDGTVDVGWWAGDEGRYARITRFPGTAAHGSYEGDWRGLPRDAELWRVWVDPIDGIAIRSACAGVQDLSSQPLERVHATSALLGPGGLELRDPSGRVVCAARLPPDRRSTDLVWAASGAETAVGGAKGACGDGVARALDTGVPAEPAAACAPFTAEGLYTLASPDHRTGLDLGRIDAVGVSRWESPFGPSESRAPDAGATWRYFYVPLGRASVTLYGPGSPCTVYRTADDGISLAGPPGYRVVPTAGHDGEIWELAACRGVYLVDVPPVVAPRRDQLLAPCAWVEDPGARADLERLGVDPGDCR